MTIENPLRRVALALAAIASILVLAAPASADSPPVDGLFSGFTGTAGCLTDYSPYAANCALSGDLGGFGRGTVHGNTLYKSFVGGGTGIAAYRINDDGSIGSRISCVNRTASLPGCTGLSPGLTGAQYSMRLTVGNGGDTLYAIQSGDTTSGNEPAMLSAFVLNADGTIGPLRNCITSSNLWGCGTTDALMVGGLDIEVGDHGIYVSAGDNESNMTRVLSYAIFAGGGIGARTSCWGATTAGGCSVMEAYMQAGAMLSHGDTLYVDSYTPSTVIAASVNTSTGAITGVRNSFSDSLIAFPSALEISPDGNTLYQNSTDTNPGDLPSSPGDYHDYQGRILAFSLAPNGSISGIKSCVSGATAGYPVPAGCAPVARSNSVGDVAISSDGRTIYAESANGYYLEDVLAYRLEADGTIGASLGCVTSTASNPPNCLPLPVPTSGEGLAVLDSGKAVISTGFYAALSIKREISPVCTSTGGPSAISGAPVQVGVTCSDANDEPLSYSITSPPTHGTLNLTGASATYTPAAGYSGSDSFAIGVSDGHVVAAQAFAMTVAAPKFKTTIKKFGKSIKASKLKSFSGTASAQLGIKAVSVGLTKLPAGGKAVFTSKAKTKRCLNLKRNGKFRTVKASSRGACKVKPTLLAKGKSNWSFELKKSLPRGRYVLVVRTSDVKGNVESGKPKTVTFFVK